MNKEHSKALLDTFPFSMDISCGDGWFDIIYKFLSNIKTFVEQNKVIILQIKEKFAELTIYYRIVDKDDTGLHKQMISLIERAKDEAAKTCEICGIQENVSIRGKFYIRNICKKCEVLSQSKDCLYKGRRME